MIEQLKLDPTRTVEDDKRHPIYRRLRTMFQWKWLASQVLLFGFNYMQNEMVSYRTLSYKLLEIIRELIGILLFREGILQFAVQRSGWLMSRSSPFFKLKIVSS